jgi:hypothetical protein
VLIVLRLASLVDYIDTTRVNMAQPTITEGQGFMLPGPQWMVSARTIASGWLFPLAGRTPRSRAGRRPWTG